MIIQNYIFSKISLDEYSPRASDISSFDTMPSTFEIGDPKNKKSYYQVYHNNLSKISKPVIKKYTEKSGYVKITFTPDYPKFDYQNLDKSNKNLMMKRTWDIAALSPENVSVFLNDQEINVKSTKNCNTSNITRVFFFLKIEYHNSICEQNISFHLR